MYKSINKCRICNSNYLDKIIDLGNLYLTGIFPKPNEQVDKSPLELCRCEKCGLVQLLHTYNLSKMYGNSYGYHSSLNKSMVNHLKDIVKYIENKININKNDYILDIGSNDCTLLKQYNKGIRFGIDPTAEKFSKYYPKNITPIYDFFPSNKLNEYIGNNKFKIITSIACFYDLEDPVYFAKSIYDLLDDNGIWIIEQSYLFSMIQSLSFDTICHEHLEYYGLQQIKYIADLSNLKIIDINFNNVNGGSFLVTLCKKESQLEILKKDLINIILNCEKDINCKKTFDKFSQDVVECKENINNFINKKNGIIGYGASTKGNVLLQYCGIDNKILPYILEVNKDKFGHETPGTKIPIINENKINKEDFNYLFVLPWHFKDNILNRNKNRNYKFIFPLPKEIHEC